MSYHVTSCHVTSCHLIWHHVTSSHVTSCHVTLHHVMSRNLMSHHVTSCHSEPKPSLSYTSLRLRVVILFSGSLVWMKKTLEMRLNQLQSFEALPCGKLVRKNCLSFERTQNNVFPNVLIHRSSQNLHKQNDVFTNVCFNGKNKYFF